MNERIQKITEAVLAGNMYPNPQRVSYDRTDMFLSKRKRDAKRIYEYVTAQKPVLREYSAMTGLFVFDGSVPGDGMSVLGLENIQGLLREFFQKPLNNLSTFEWQHATADYNMLIRKGIRGLISDIEVSKKEHVGDTDAVEFLDALKTVAEAMIAWAHKCADESEKLANEVENAEYRDNLIRLSNALRRVPENKAESFFEAVLSIYILFSYDPDSLGVLDRTLYDFYENDLESGKLTREQAKEYLQELFLMLQSKTPRNSKLFTRGGESHFCIGGYLPNGEDGFNDLSLLILEAMTELPTYIPQISLRWTKKTPFETFKKVMDFERKDPNKRIAFINDEKKLIAGFVRRLGFSFEDACAYTSVGCNENAFPGGFVGGTSTNNALRCMENTFFKRCEDVLSATDFDAFFEIFKSELLSDLDEMLYNSDQFNLIRAKDTSYVTSLLFPDCIKEAKPYSQGAIKRAVAGVSMVGIVNVIDSLAIVKQFVFDEKIVTMKQLVDALSNNWEGYDDLHTLIRKKGKFFGNDDETSNYVAEMYFGAIYEHINDKRNVFGYPLSIGNLQGYNHHHAWFGAGTRATPDGRRDGEMLKFGIGQSAGYDREGLTALLSSVAKCDKRCIMTCSSVTNVYLDEQLVKNEDSFHKLVGMMESYFKMGGSHFQLNYLSKEDLKKAKLTPDEYRSLRVRVSGFSDYFVNLNSSIQDDIIKRTEHNG